MDKNQKINCTVGSCQYNDNQKQEIDKEVLAEEYRLGKEYYNKLLEESPKETEKYN